MSNISNIDKHDMNDKKIDSIFSVIFMIQF